MDTINGFLGGTATEAIGTLNNASALVLNDVVPVINDTVLPVGGCSEVHGLLVGRCRLAGGLWEGRPVADAIPSSGSRSPFPRLNPPTQRLLGRRRWRRCGRTTRLGLWMFRTSGATL